MYKRFLPAGVLICAVVGQSAPAAEVVVYEYDAQGRLVETVTTSGPAAGTQRATIYDPAGNRTNQTVTGAPTGGGSAPSFAISNASAIEGGNLTFTITKTGAATASHSLSYTTANGSALAGSDYTAKSGTLTFTAGQTSQTVVIATANDSMSEATESMTVNISGPTGGATISDGQGTGTITDNDPSNSPPTPIADYGSMPICSSKQFNLTANDTDPEGNYPLVVLSISGPLSASLASGSSVNVTSSSGTGSKVMTYVVRDSLGSTASSTLTVNVSGGICY